MLMMQSAISYSRDLHYDKVTLGYGTALSTLLVATGLTAGFLPLDAFIGTSGACLTLIVVGYSGHTVILRGS